jgi:CheY-like chemotaxis protein
MDEAGSSGRLILLVDDNEDDVILIRRAFEKAGLKQNILALPSGMEAMAYFRGGYPYFDRSKYRLPDLVLLDIKMPGTDGFEVLRWIRQQWDLSDLCVVMLTSSDEIRDVNRAYQLGANSFLVKPLDFVNARELWASLERLLAARQRMKAPPSRVNPTTS